MAFEGNPFFYFSDREAVEWSVPHIEQFLKDVIDRSGARRLHLIAHSMGNQGLIRALYQIVLRSGAKKRPLFENVIMAAPDFDSRRFTEQIAPELIPLAKRWTLQRCSALCVGAAPVQRFSETGAAVRLSLALILDLDLDFNSVELLTLSACETAVGGAGADGRGDGWLAQRQGA